MAKPLTTVDKVLNCLDGEIALEFRQWARWRSLSEIHHRIDELYNEAKARGVELLHRGKEIPPPSYNSCSNWFEQTFPDGRKATELGTTVRDYSGVRKDALTYAEMAIAITAHTLEQTQFKLEELIHVEEDPDTYKSLLFIIHNMAKELRTGAIALHETRLLEDRRRLYVEGAYRMVQILQSRAKDANKENQVTDIIEAAIAQLESEANG